jgi:hypothetical protein
MNQSPPTSLRVIPYSDLNSLEQLEFFDFCYAQAETREPAAANMTEVPELIRQRFSGDKGVMLVVFDGVRIIGCSGCYVSDFSPHIGLLGARSWLLKEYRAQQIIRDHVWPMQRDMMIGAGMKQVAVTFNDYNRNLAHFVKRNVVKRAPKTPRHLFYLNKTALNYPVVIQHTPQWVIYEKLDPHWSFDWFTLSYRAPDLVE